MVLDPTLSEETVMDGRMIIGMNVHREICAIQMIGGVVILPDQASMIKIFNAHTTNVWLYQGQ